MKSQGITVSYAFIALAMSFISQTLSATAYPHFQFGSFAYSDTVTLPYRLFIPENYNPNLKYPIVLAMHGLGKRGNDNEKQLTVPIVGRWADADFQSYQQCFVIAPQCPTGEVWVKAEPGGYDGSYTRNDTSTTDYLRAAWGILDDVIANYSIDIDRQYVCGHSAGGYGTWDTIYHFPDRFAAAMPSAGGGDPSTADRLINMKVWTVHGSDDTTVPSSGSTDMIDAILAAGGSADFAKVKIFQGVGHDSSTPVMLDPEIPFWFLRQVKGQSLDNLLANGSFEQSIVSAAPWQLSSSGAVDVKSKPNTVEGSYALRMINSAAPTSQTVNVTPNTDYVLSAWVNNELVTSGNVFIDTNDVFDNGTQTPGGNAQIRVKAGDAQVWTKFIGTFNSGSETSVTIRIFSSNMTGTAFIDDLNLVEYVDPYLTWKSEHNVVDDLGDEDGDGLSNLMEFALNGDPKRVESGKIPTVAKNGNDLNFEFHRGEASVTYTIEGSYDLSNWSAYTHTVIDLDGAVGEDISITIPNALMSSNGKMFLRLKVEN